MPLIEIASVDRPGIDKVVVCRRLNAAVADALGARLDAVWSTWLTIDVDVRGDRAATDESTAPAGPIVHVYHHRTAEQVDRIVDAIRTVLARDLSVEQDAVFVTTQPVEMPDLTLD